MTLASEVRKKEKDIATAKLKRQTDKYFLHASIGHYLCMPQVNSVGILWQTNSDKNHVACETVDKANQVISEVMSG